MPSWPPESKANGHFGCGVTFVRNYKLKVQTTNYKGFVHFYVY